MSKQIIFVLSSNYSGSHFLSLMLGSHTNCASVGELHRFKREEDRRRKVCYTCPEDSTCPLFKGITNDDIKDIYKLLFDNASAMDSRITTLIDNSKKHKWAERFVTDDRFERKYIHLIRDPRALVRRWMMTYGTEKQKKKVRRKMARRAMSLKMAFGNDEEDLYLRKWLYQNRLISNFISDKKLDAETITYYDVATNAEQVLTDTMNWLGLEFEPLQSEYWKFTHHGSQKSEYQHVNDNTPKFHDQRWRDFLSPEVQLSIAGDEELLAYLQSQSLTLTDNGLVTNK